MKYKIVKENTKPVLIRDSSRKCVRKNVVFSFVRQLSGVILLLAVVCCILFVTVPFLPDKPFAEGKQNVGCGVLELWNIESFEGGVGSRQTWLLKRASEFEQASKGLYVHVTTLTYEQAKDKLDSGERFDLVGFSRGVGNLFVDKLCSLSSPVGLSENLRKSATLGSSMYAYPYYSGIYCLFARQSELSVSNLLAECTTKTVTRKVGKNTFTLQPLASGFAEFNSPYTALRASGVVGQIRQSEQWSQYVAYEKFVGHKSFVTLLGTQRDLYRLSRRVADGKIEPLSVLPLDGYNDLVQYVGVAAECENIVAAKNFCNYLIADKSQSKLVDNALFSVLQEGDFYTDEVYVTCQKAVRSAFVPNVFDSPSVIAEQRKEVGTVE